MAAPDLNIAKGDKGDSPLCHLFTSPACRADRALSGVVTLGPGRRIALWMAGCSKHCPGCANPELWEAKDSQLIETSALASALRAMGQRADCRALTITGGDPFEQPDALISLLTALREDFDDILVYTGYIAEDIRTAIGDAAANLLHGLIDVLIDGPYVEALNDNECPLRGSTNQRVIVLNPALKEAYDAELARPRRVQNVYFDGRAMSVGIHNREGAAAAAPAHRADAASAHNVSAPTPEKPAIAISACLAGEACTYKASHNLIPELEKLATSYTLVPLCPECLGGLSTPRPPAEIRGGRVVNCEGDDVTAAYRDGAAAALAIARREGCVAALLKANSPSCGVGHIYDGTFSHTVVPGNGITAQAFLDAGIPVFDETQVRRLMERLCPQ